MTLKIVLYRTKIARYKANIMNQNCIKFIESRYKQCDPTLFHREKSIEKILRKDKY